MSWRQAAPAADSRSRHADRASRGSRLASQSRSAQQIAADDAKLRIFMVAEYLSTAFLLAVGDLFNGVAREVVEHYGEDIAAHPVGIGAHLQVSLSGPQTERARRSLGTKTNPIGLVDVAAPQVIAKQLWRGRGDR